jgi:phage terminase large subunit-like protein
VTRGERVCEFITRYCRVPEGAKVGLPLVLADFQRRFILEIYDNPHGTRRAYLAVSRKNGKSGLIACILLAHLCGPEAKQNSQIVSGAMSRDQAALVFELAKKMVQLSPELSKLVRVVPSGKRLIGLARNVEYRALAADGATAHGLSPVLAILDEVGQVKGPRSDFVDAITTAQGAHDEPLLIAISTQAPTDADLFSIWLDDAKSGLNKHMVCHLYTAPEGCDVEDEAGWKAANPALDLFRSRADLAEQANAAKRMPSSENAFRVLCLNQRVELNNPFVSRAVWQSCVGKVEDVAGLPIYCGLDLSECNDLTALVMVAPTEGKFHVRPTFWLPADGLRERSLKDRVPYDQWAKEGHLETTPGKSIEYEFVAEHLRGLFDRHDVRAVAFDRWGWRHLKPWLERAGFSEEEIGRFVEFGQGFQSMSPALRDLESALLNGKLVHDGHPVLTMCAANAVVQADPAGNRKLTKAKSRGRIDGMVSLTMAMSVAATHEEGPVINLDDFLANAVMTR